MHFVSPTFAALVAAYQVLCSHLDALQAKRVVDGQMPADFADDDDGLTTSLRLVRQARIARKHLRAVLGDQIAAAVRDGAARSTIVEHVRADLDALVAQQTLRPDPGLLDEIMGWVIEAYPGERSKADYAGTA